MSQPFVLSIDFGTQSVRTIIYNQKGEEQGKTKIPFLPYFSQKNGWAEQNADVYWDNLVLCLGDLQKNYKSAFDNITAIGVTTIRDT
ncbi:MAG: FGGY family carbohydrate kinase, partial [Clostridia bacterium]